MSDNVFASMLRYARLKELSADELQERVVFYKSSPDNQTDNSRNEIIDGAMGIVARRVIAATKRNGQWDLAVDRMQNGVLTAYEALERYNAGKSLGFADYLVMRLKYALIDDYRESFSVVKIDDKAPIESDLPVKGMLDDTGVKGAYLGEDIADPAGSALDVLVTREAANRHDSYAEALSEFQAVRNGLLKFMALPPEEKDHLRRDMGMSYDTLRQVVKGLSASYLTNEDVLDRTTRGVGRVKKRKPVEKRPPAQPGEPMCPLTDELRQNFIELKQRKGVSIDQVVGSLAEEFSKAAIQRSANSAYTVLHSASAPRQPNMAQSVVDALHRVYAPLPDVNYLPAAPAFQQLSTILIQTASTHTDLGGIARQAGLAYTNSQIKEAYNSLSQKRGAVPIDLVDQALAALTPTPTPTPAAPMPMAPMPVATPRSQTVGEGIRQAMQLEDDPPYLRNPGVPKYS